jgi:hypothetical protein
MNSIQKFTRTLSTRYTVEISAIIDANGGHWFPATETAKALVIWMATTRFVSTVNTHNL